MTRPIIDEIIDAILLNERYHGICGEKNHASGRDSLELHDRILLQGFGARERRHPEATGEAPAASRFSRIG
jgi:hypothetical protein